MYLERGHTLLIPVGATEGHGDHLPSLTDTLIAEEIAKRVAAKIDALVAPSLCYGLSQTFSGIKGSAWLTGKTFISVIEDLSLSFARSGFKRIIYLSAHSVNNPALTIACTDITGTDRLGSDVKVYSLPYSTGVPPHVMKDYESFEAGFHANVGETSEILSIDSDLVDLEHPSIEWPDMPKDLAVLLVMSSSTGSWKKIAPKSGVWGDPNGATKEKGELIINAAVEGIVHTISKLEEAFRLADSVT